MDKISLDLSSIPPLGIFYNRMSASSHTRGHRYAPEYTATVLNWLEFHNRRVINNSKALNIELSKSLQYKELQKEKIKVPKTAYAQGTSHLILLIKVFPESAKSSTNNTLEPKFGVVLARSREKVNSPC